MLRISHARIPLGRLFSLASAEVSSVDNPDCDQDAMRTGDLVQYRGNLDSFPLKMYSRPTSLKAILTKVSLKCLYEDEYGLNKQLRDWLIRDSNPT